MANSITPFSVTDRQIADMLPVQFEIIAGLAFDIVYCLAPVARRCSKSAASATIDVATGHHASEVGLAMVADADTDAVRHSRHTVT